MASSPGSEQGASGLVVSAGGYVTEELHPSLAGRRALDTWRQMKDNDALCGAILFAIEMLLRQVEWNVEQQEAKEADAQFLEECIDDMSMSWGDFISEALSMLPFGFAFHEIVYKQRKGPSTGAFPGSKYNDGKIGWRKIPLRAQETLDHWDFDDEGGVKAFVQKAAPTYVDVPIPMEKGLLFRSSVYKNNPEGRSVFRSAYASWFYKKRIQQIEGTGIERDLAGFPVFWIPSEYLDPNAPAEHKAVAAGFMQVGENIRRDRQEYLIMPLAYDDNGNKAFDFTLTASSGTRQFDTSAIIQRYNQEIAMSVLADFILLGHEKVGSFALSSDKTDLFAVAMGTVLDTIADVLNRFAVPRLFALNGLDQENLPKIAHGDIEKPDLAALSTYITSLSGAGVPLFPDDDLEAYLREAANLPEVSEETKQAREDRAAKVEEQMNAAATAGPGGGGPAGGPGGGGQQPPKNNAGAGKPGQQGAARPSTGQRNSSSAGAQAGSVPSGGTQRH